MTASRLEPHNRLTVVAGTEVGRPASSSPMRPTLRLSSPAWLAHPHTMSSIAAGSSEVLESTAETAAAAKSSGRTPASVPPSLPKGVRVTA